MPKSWEAFSPGNLLKSGAKFTNPEVLAAARRVADYVPDDSLLRSKLFLRVAAALFELYKKRPESSSLIGHILNERLGKLGDYIFVMLSESRPETSPSESSAVHEQNRGLSPEDRKILVAVVRELDGKKSATAIGALTLLIRTHERMEEQGRLPILAREFVLEMADPAKEIIRDRWIAKEEAGELEEIDMSELVRLELDRFKEEASLAVQILQNSGLIGPTPD